MEAICAAESIACDFARVDGYLFAESAEEDEVLTDELEAAHRAGLTDVTRVSDVQTGRVALPSALRFPGQGQLHPLKYLRGLIDAIERRGGKIHGKTQAMDVEDGRLWSCARPAGHAYMPTALSWPAIHPSTTCLPCIPSRRHTAPSWWA
ncbi:FAD-dependent oxidoreductase [Ralstonia sp. TCR112]|uniref:FAD-dependent oxidoreductase n=1 Tax=Ralstonia sp. TCR112 TaxID=2601730 RepID=UPI003965CC10